MCSTPNGRLPVDGPPLMWPTMPTSAPRPTPTRTVYVTVSCPGCQVDVLWLGMVEPCGGTRYTPADCDCPPLDVLPMAG